MKLNFLVYTSALKSKVGTILGVGTLDALVHLGKEMNQVGIQGDLYDLPNGSRNPGMASPFSLNNGFALNVDEINLLKIPELKKDQKLHEHLLELISNSNEICYNSPRINYNLVRTVSPIILEGCFQIFQSNIDERRKTKFEKFLKLTEYWLKHYAVYEAYKAIGIDFQDTRFADLNSKVAQTFIKKHKNLIQYYEYVQFLCYEQRKNALKQLRKYDVGLVVNLPFGVSHDSADVFFHPEAFDQSLQVGCSPEPEHGYPEQAWGVAVYREKTEGLKSYLKNKMKWISQLGDGVFFDHLVGWAGQYTLPKGVEIEEGNIQGAFFTEDLKKRKSNMRWFLNLVLSQKLKVRGEVAGDFERVQATNNVILELAEKGKDVSAMCIPRWEDDLGQIKRLSTYNENDLVMYGTHDTSTPYQYLLNWKGNYEDFESSFRLAEYCNRVLGLPFHVEDIPLDGAKLTQSFFRECMRRLCQGTKAENVVFTLPGFLSFLSPKYRNVAHPNNINVQPGTTGEVGNLWSNWSFFSQPVESLSEDQDILDTVKLVGKRKYLPFHCFERLELLEGDQHKINILVSNPKNREVIYTNSEGSWDVLPKDLLDIDKKPILELVIHNYSKEEAWGNIDLSNSLNLKETSSFVFYDLSNLKQKEYVYSGKKLEEDYLFVKLSPKKRHHFLVFPKN